MQRWNYLIIIFISFVEFFLDNYYMLLVPQLKPFSFIDLQVLCVWESVIKL